MVQNDRRRLDYWEQSGVVQECIDDYQRGGILASVSIALILSGRMEHPDSLSLIRANDGNRNRGALLYPGIARARTFSDVVKILGDPNGELERLNKKWNLERFDREPEKVTGYISPGRIRLYAGPGKGFAKLRYYCKKGTVKISAVKNGYGKVAGSVGWIELAKLEKAGDD